MNNEATTSDNVYHQHLDKCVRCANNPFDLCAEGSRLLVKAVLDFDYDAGTRIAPPKAHE